jgi:hypothetical protein
MRKILPLLLTTNAASAVAQSPETTARTPTASIEYVVKANEIVSTILFKLGIGTPKSPHRIYGEDGYLARLRKDNPGVNIDQLAPGDRIRLALPPEIAAGIPGTGGAVPPSVSSPGSKQEATRTSDVRSKAITISAVVKRRSDAPPRTENGAFDCSLKPTDAAVNPAKGKFAAIKKEVYVVAAGDTISTVLYGRGIGRPDGLARLFGKQGWIARNKALNAGRADLSKLHAGQEIVLIYPVQTATDPCKSPLRPDAEIAARKARAEQESEAKQQAASVVAAPEKATLSEIVSLNVEDQKKIGTQEIVKKLDDDTIASLDDKTAEKIPPSAVEEKAAEVSIFDADKPGMEKLFKNFKLTTPAAYLGARVGFSLAAREEALLSKVVSYGLLAEIRDGPAQGLRVIYETVPKITANSAGYSQSLEYNRLLLGWAFEFPAPLLFDLLHITPRLGRYQIEAKTPAGETATGEKLSNTLAVPSAVGAGLEVDAEWAKYFYVLRLWGSRDIVLPVIENNFVSITTRAGVDVYVKGGAFTLFDTKFSPNYLVFAAYEGILLRGDVESTRGKEVSLDLPTAGLGFTVTTN